MQVITVKSARKDYPDEGIRKGDTYYKWSFKFGGTCRSKIYPRPSQLTTSPFLAEFFSIREGLGDGLPSVKSPEDLQSVVESALLRIDDLLSDTEENLGNMPEQLQEGDTGQLLQDRIDGLQDWKTDLEFVDLDYEVIAPDQPDHPTPNEGESVEDFDQRVREWEDERLQEWINEKVDEIGELDPDLY